MILKIVIIVQFDLTNVKFEEYISLNIGHFNLWSNQKLGNKEISRFNETK